MPAILDNLIHAKAIRPIIVAFVPMDQKNYLNETIDNDKDKYAGMLETELIPALGAQYRLTSQREDRLLLGNGFGAYTSLYAGLLKPETFGNVATLSIWSYQPYTEMLEPLSKKGDKPPVTIQLGWCAYESNDLLRGIHPDRESKKIAGMLEQGGHQVATLVMPGTHGWGTWRAGMDKVLKKFFGI